MKRDAWAGFNKGHVLGFWERITDLTLGKRHFINRRDIVILILFHCFSFNDVTFFFSEVIYGLVSMIFFFYVSYVIKILMFSITFSSSNLMISIVLSLYDYISIVFYYPVHQTKHRKRVWLRKGGKTLSLKRQKKRILKRTRIDHKMMISLKKKISQQVSK